MKTLKYFMFVVALAMTVAGCRKSVEVSFSADSQTVEAEGGVVEIELTSNGDWTLESTAEWISVQPTSGSGDATLTLTVLPNTSLQSRTAEVRATTADNSAVLKVTQSFPNHYINLDPVAYECYEEGGEFSLHIASNIDWTVMVLPNWIQFSEMSGSGDAQVVVSVSAFGDGTMLDRESIVTLGNDETTAVLRVSQRHTPPVTISADPENLVMACEGETKTFAVICEGAWTAILESDWATMDKTEGEGNAEIAVTVTENPLYEQRWCDVKLISSSGNTASVTINQEATPNPHFLEVNPTDLAFGSEGGTEEITIGCDTDWVVDLQSSWVSLSAMSGNGNATITVTVEPNLVNEIRRADFAIVSGSLTQRLHVTQAAGETPVVATFEPDTLFVPYIGGTAQLELTANSTWNLELDVDWVMLSSATTGEGNASVHLIVDYNGAAMGRIGRLNVKNGGVIIASAIIVQEGRPDIFEVDITEIEVRPEGGEYIIHVTANQSWSVSANVTWITCTPTSGNNNGAITLSVQPIPPIQTRVGTVKVKGATGQEIVVTVTQHQ